MLAVGLSLGVAPVVGEGTNREATPNPTLVLATSPATETQSAAGGSISSAAADLAQTGRKKNGRRVFIESRITDAEAPIISEVNAGTFVGIKCPNGSIAVSGGVLTSYINLLVSSSAPNNPITGKYTPKIWWLTVTNANIDGKNGALPWRGVVNCMSPVKLKR